MASDEDDEYFGEMMEMQFMQDEDLDHPSGSTVAPPVHVHSALLSKPVSYFHPRLPHGLVGLENLGATCYLNSLLQALYLTPEFRSALYELDEDEIGVAAYEEEQRAKQQKEEGSSDTEERQQEEDEQQQSALADVSEVDVHELVSMGFDEHKVRRALQRFASSDQREQAIDFILSLPDDPPPSSAPRPPPPPPSARPYRRIPIAFRIFFSHLQLLNHASLPTTLITSAFGWTNLTLGQQHDIHELFTRLCEAMEGSLKALHGHSLISSLFSGTLRRTLTCTGCSSSRHRKEDFYSLHLPIAACRTVHVSLAHVFESERLMLGCEGCGGKRMTVSSSCVERFPFLLTFALGRHEYDREKGVRVKLGDEFAFPLVLDMRLYGEEVDEDDKRRQEKELIALRIADERNGKKKPNGADHSSDYHLLPSHFDPASPHLYDLFAVIVHAGSAHSGHYFAYIRDVLRDVAERRAAGWWWKCNDSAISAVDVEVIASQYGGKKESAYMLMYRHRTQQSSQPRVPVVPSALLQAAAAHNAQLQEDRVRYDEFKHAIRVQVWTERAVFVKGDKIIELERDDPAVTPAKPEEQKHKDKAKHGAAAKKGGGQEKNAKQLRREEEDAMREDQRRAKELVVAAADDDKREEDRKGKFTFVVDERLPMAALYAQVRERLRWTEAEGGELRLNRAERSEEEREEEGRRLEGSLPYHGMKERDEEKIPDDHLHLEADYSQSLADLGVRHGDVLLAWNGHSLHEHPFFTGFKRPKRLRFSVRWVKDVEDVLEFVCYLPAEATVREMVELLRRRVGEEADLQLFLITKRALTPIDLTMGHVKLMDVDVTNSSTLVLELSSSIFPSSPPGRRALAYFQSQSSRVKLIVQDRLSPASPPAEDLTLRMDKSTTLLQLKRQLLLSHPGVSEDQCRLRKMTGTDRVGGVLEREQLTLLEAELDDDDVMVRLEPGPLPTPGQLDLVVTFIDDGGAEQLTVLEQRPLMFDSRWTVKQSKLHILDAGGDARPESRFLLFRGDAAGSAKDKLFANEFVTLDRLHLHHGASLFLHVGELPIQGKITLDVFLYTPSLLTAELPSLARLLHQYEHEESKEDVHEPEPKPMVVADPALLVSASPSSMLDMPTRSSLLSFLLTLPFSSGASLLDLKTAIHSLSSLSSLPSPAYLRIRTLNKADELHSMLTDDALPLKRQGISTDRRLAVQILSRTETDVVSSAFLLRAMLVLPRRGGGGVEMVPPGAVELLFSASLHPQVDELRGWAAREVGEVKEGVVVLKWLGGDRRWQLIRAAASHSTPGTGLDEEKRPPGLGGDNNKERAGGRQPQQGKPTVPSLLSAPYHLHQQDLCAIVPVRLFSSLSSLHSDERVLAAVEADCRRWTSPVLRMEPGVTNGERKEAGRKQRKREELELTIDY